MTLIAATASEPEANERGSSLISRRLHYRACNYFFLLNARNCGYAQVENLVCAVVCREELCLCASGRFSMHSGIPQGIVVMREW